MYFSGIQFWGTTRGKRYITLLCEQELLEISDCIDTAGWQNVAALVI